MPPRTVKLSKKFKTAKSRRWAKFGWLYLALLYSYCSLFWDIRRHPTCLQSDQNSGLYGLKRPQPQMVKLAASCDVAQSAYCDAGPCLARHISAIYRDISAIFRGSIVIQYVF